MCEDPTNKVQAENINYKYLIRAPSRIRIIESHNKDYANVYECLSKILKIVCHQMPIYKTIKGMKKMEMARRTRDILRLH